MAEAEAIGRLDTCADGSSRQSSTRYSLRSGHYSSCYHQLLQWSSSCSTYRKLPQVLAKCSSWTLAGRSQCCNWSDGTPRSRIRRLEPTHTYSRPNAAMTTRSLGKAGSRPNDAHRHMSQWMRSFA